MATFISNGTPITSPSPQYDIPLVSNNGVLKARHQSGLPLGYTLLDYIESDGTQYIDTGFIADNTTGFYIDAQKTTDNSADSVVYGSRASTNARCWLDIDHSGSTEYEGRVLFGWGNYTQAGGTDVDNRVAVYLNRFTGSFNYNNTRKVFIDNIERPWYNQQLEDTLPTQTGSIYMFGGNTAGSFSVPWYGRIYNFKITQNSNLVHNFIPAKNSSNIIGMYDTVSGQFFTNAGTGDFIAGTAVSDPVEIYTDGTVETINVHGKNLFDAIADNIVVGYYIDNAGNYTSSTQNFYTTEIEVKPNTIYTLSMNSTSPALRIAEYNSSHTFITRTTTTSVDSMTITTTANTKYVRLSCNIDGTSVTVESVQNAHFQLEQGSTATAYEPYYDGGTATAEMLLKVGDYTDVQEILSGAVTRNVGVKVLDGTEDWTARSGSSTHYAYFDYSGINANTETELYCTHFGVSARNTPEENKVCVRLNLNGFLFCNDLLCANVTTWTQYLADQYAAGTPVTVIYPLAQAGTEQVAPQVLNVQTGDNILEITQASLSNLELEAEYSKSA